MFKRKCPRCSEKCSRDFEFCPYCGLRIKQPHNEEDYGLLGKKDIPEEFEMFNQPMLGFGSGILSRMLGNTMKMLQKELQKSTEQEIKNSGRENSQIKHFQLYINGKKVNLSNLQPGQVKKIQLREPGIVKEAPKHPILSEETIKNSVHLPKEEAECKLRRAGNKIIYEINVPGVNSLDKVLINKLENSMEIKAYSKEKIYKKILPINLPFLGYHLNKQKLFLEFQGK